eukprot:496254-Rhodomonas_salina.2
MGQRGPRRLDVGQQYWGSRVWYKAKGVQYNGKKWSGYGKVCWFWKRRNGRWPRRVRGEA